MAQDAATGGTPSTAAEEITAADLGVQNVGLLPTSRFYFFKEWRRGISRFFTFNPVKKAELDLKITDEKAAELLEVQKTAPEAAEDALKNYEKAQERLKKTFEGLKETSENPNVDLLLEKLADRTVKHTQLFDELSRKAEHESAKSIIQNIRARIMEAAVGASEKDKPEKFAEKIGKALEDVKGGELKNLRALEIMDEFENAAPDDLKQILRDKYQSEFHLKLKDDLSGAIEGGNLEKIKEGFAGLPGDEARRSVIFEEFKQKIKEPDEDDEKSAPMPKKFREALEEFGEIFDKAAEEDKHIAEKSAEQIKRAEEAVKELESALAGITIDEPGAPKPKTGIYNGTHDNDNQAAEKTAPVRIDSTPARISTNMTIGRQTPKTDFGDRMKAGLEMAGGMLEKAKTAFADGKFGEAFGQARAAEVAARRAMRAFQSPERNRKSREGEDKIKDMEECGIRPGAPGNWVCENGKWKNEKSESGNEIKRIENKESEDEPSEEVKKMEETEKVETPEIKSETSSEEKSSEEVGIKEEGVR